MHKHIALTNVEQWNNVLASQHHYFSTIFGAEPDFGIFEEISVNFVVSE